ncbi:hypothetical protein EZH22_16265 [Xanthobacter dioxanivorans]|uniref:Uncharacterized protein n=1 Tax=Xanthobacter dioxanivorans TaxID=2528964 RepID=A0A974SHT6_9HYPH|nr:hypothetical protein [Xanthobacter dioxanivorans]QRG04718.1 hypothetical protein EZH22_16265 [Xanthobacter dioxanivorans]
MRSTLLAALGFAALASAPAAAQQLTADQAREFVVGRNFTFNCFEGTKGSGRVYPDGSVAGIITIRDNAPRFVRLPPNTLRVRGEAVCGFVKGMTFEPCFDLVKTSTTTFRGSLSGVQTMWCDFVSFGTERQQVASRRSKSKARSPAEASAE